MPPQPQPQPPAARATTTVRIPSVITTGLVVVSAVFPALSLLSIFLRRAARSGVKNGWQIDDWMIVITWIITFGASVIVWASIPLVGIDYIKPSTSISRYQATCVWSLTLLMQAALATVKLSILLFYKRIFPTPKFKLAAWVGIAVVSAWGIVAVICHTIVGDPVSSSWTGGGKFRMNPVKLSLARAGSSLALDILILLFPIQKIVYLHITPKRKVAVGLIFALGSFCAIAAAVRLYYVHMTVAVGAGSKAAGFTKIARTSKTVIWGIIEPNCSIIAASLPCYGPLLRGRAPESIIASVRSVLSLGSRGSNNSGRSNGSKPYGATATTRAAGLAVPKKSPKDITESEIELNDLSGTSGSAGGSIREWERGNAGTAYVASVERPAPAATPREGGIQVTTSYDTREHV